VKRFDVTQITDVTDVAPRPVPPVSGTAKDADVRYYTASQFQLTWWKFRKHRLALGGMFLLAIFAIIAVFAEFLSPYAPGSRTPNYLLAPPQDLHFVDAEGNFTGAHSPTQSRRV
jgi:peptide/nickel transport system permease protein